MQRARTLLEAGREPGVPDDDLAAVDGLEALAVALGAGEVTRPVDVERTLLALGASGDRDAGILAADVRAVHGIERDAELCPVGTEGVGCRPNEQRCCEVGADVARLVEATQRAVPGGVGRLRRRAGCAHRGQHHARKRRVRCAVRRKRVHREEDHSGNRRQDGLAGAAHRADQADCEHSSSSFGGCRGSDGRVQKSEVLPEREFVLNPTKIAT